MADTPPRATRALHCPNPACGGRILGTVPRDMHGTFYLRCPACAQWVVVVVKVEYRDRPVEHTG